jgi:heme exporter protein B
MPSVSTQSNLVSEIKAVFLKEWRSEFRSLSGLTTLIQLTFVSLVIINNITMFDKVKPLLAAGLYWMILVFVGSITLPRTFLQEEENRTADFWRLVARPEAVFWGKALFNILQIVVTAFLLGIGLLIMLQLPVKHWEIFVANALLGSMAIAITVTLAGALASAAKNRYAVCAAISVPLLVVVVNLGVTGTAFALGEFMKQGERGPIAMLMYCIGAGALGPVVYCKVWKV